jgi:OmpA-OmpF porin, OOP family
MKKIFASLFVIVFAACAAFSQNSDNIRPRALGISFIMNDFGTAQKIRNGSLEQVLREKTWSKFRDMSPGLALTYFQGLKSHVDFAGTLVASYVNYPVPNKTISSDNLLLEVDASINLKLLSDRYWVTPYLTAGIGGSRYKSYYGAILPLGGGFKVNFYDEAALFFGTQYRVGITKETTASHFLYSIGIAGVIGK